MDSHFCNEHKTKFYKNEKTDKAGNLSVWYSHKKLDGTGFCSEKSQKDDVVYTSIAPKRAVNMVDVTSRNIFSCNAMNNAIALACNGKIELDQIGKYYNKILSELVSNNQ